MNINTNFEKIKLKFKELVNKIRFPRLVDFIFKFPNSAKKAIDAAPPAPQNWVRLGLEKTWIYFLIAAIVIAVAYAKDALIFFINIATYAIALIPLGALVYYWFFRKKQSKNEKQE